MQNWIGLISILLDKEASHWWRPRSKWHLITYGLFLPAPPSQASGNFYPDEFLLEKKLRNWYSVFRKSKPVSFFYSNVNLFFCSFLPHWTTQKLTKSNEIFDKRAYEQASNAISYFWIFFSYFLAKQIPIQQLILDYCNLIQLIAENNGF